MCIWKLITIRCATISVKCLVSFTFSCLLLLSVLVVSVFKTEDYSGVKLKYSGVCLTLTLKRDKNKLCLILDEKIICEYISCQNLYRQQTKVWVHTIFMLLSCFIDRKIGYPLLLTQTHSCKMRALPAPVANGPSLTGFCWMGWATNTQISQQENHHRDWPGTTAIGRKSIKMQRE